MSTKRATPEDRARDYIDSILAINRKYGMQPHALPAEVYEEAIVAATDAYRDLGRRVSRTARESA